MADYSSIVPKGLMIADDDDRSRTRWRLIISEDHEVSLDTRTYYGGDGTPFDEWHKRTLAYTLAGPGVIDSDRLRDDLRDGGSLATLIDRVIAGHDVAWDGNNNRGRFTDDAREADIALGEELSGDTCRAYFHDSLVLWDVAEWMCADGSNSTATQLDFAGLLPESDPEGEAVKDSATAVRDHARCESVILTGNVEDYLASLIRDAQAEAADA